MSHFFDRKRSREAEEQREDKFTQRISDKREIEKKKSEEEEKLKALIERVAALKNENENLRTLIHHELCCDVVFLPQPSPINLPMTSDRQVDPIVLQEEGWRFPTKDTLYVWDESNGEKTGTVAFAVFFQPEEMMVGVEKLLQIFNLGKEYRYALKRKSKHFREKGKCYGIGLRPGYESGLSYGTYKVPAKNGQEGSERESQEGNKMLEKLSNTIASLLETTVRNHLPREYQEKVRLSPLLLMSLFLTSLVT